MCSACKPLKLGRPCLRHEVLALPKAAIKSLAMTVVDTQQRL